MSELDYQKVCIFGPTEIALKKAIDLNICTFTFDKVKILGYEVSSMIEYFGDINVLKKMTHLSNKPLDDNTIYSSRRYNLLEFAELVMGDIHAARDKFRKYIAYLKKIFEETYGQEFVRVYYGEGCTLDEFIKQRMILWEDQTIPNINGFYGNEQDLAVLIAFFCGVDGLRRFKNDMAISTTTDEYEFIYSQLFANLFWDLVRGELSKK